MANPIETAVSPLKTEAQDRAEQYAQNIVTRILGKLAECDNDAHAAYPFPHGGMSRADYIVARNNYGFCRDLTENAYKGCRRPRDPEPVVPSEERIAKFLLRARETAAAEYDQFVAKLCSKIGETVAAELDGNHVWGHSILTVTLPDGTVQRWKTQTIGNVSKLGKLFNQWPTRQVK